MSWRVDYLFAGAKDRQIESGQGLLSSFCPQQAEPANQPRTRLFKKCTQNHTQSTRSEDLGSSKTGETCRGWEVKNGFPQKYMLTFADVQIFDRLRYGSPVVRVFDGSYKRRVSPGGGVLSRGHCADAGKELRQIVF